MIEKVMKRNGELVTYDRDKIRRAIAGANREIMEKYKDEKQTATTEEIEHIIEQIEVTCEKEPSVEKIQDAIETYLVGLQKYKLAKAYIIYRYERSLVREQNSTDESILGIIHRTNKAAMDENSNKNAIEASTQRDLIAGEVSRDLTNRILLPEKIAKAHREGILHFHDGDYFVQEIFNCCLINIKDMLDNGTVMNGKLIESPKSFQVACTVLSQIIATVSSNQYGGQSVAVKHLAKYLRKTYKKAYNRNIAKYGEGLAKEIAHDRMLEDLKNGIQTLQYQINTLMTTNGQAPFVTLFLEIDESDEYLAENLLIIEEVLKQRIQGIKNEKGQYVTPAFPKLIYVLDEHNCLKGGKYDYLTKLAVKCSSKRMYPDYISAKIMRENYDGEVFSCMGCRSFLSPWKDENGNYKWEGRFNQGVVSINLPQIGILAAGDETKFWTLLEERLALCFEALMCRHKALLGTTSDISPIHWQHGAIARLRKGEVIDKYLKDGYSTISLGYIGLYETVIAMKGCSHTEEEGRGFALKIMNMLKNTTDRWKEMTGIGFGLYGTPAESLCYRFAKIDQERFGMIKDITDKGFYTNSYHVDVRERIGAFEKLEFEAPFQKISSGGAISYVEVSNMNKNLDAFCEVVRFIYDNIQYAEFNTKSDACMKCGFEGEIILDEENEWTCPNCGNKDRKTINVTRRTCGYIGENFWNVGKTKEIGLRVTHL